MIVGTCKIRLHLPGNHSLKGKRRIIKSLLDRVRSRFNVSICEIEDQDKWQLATLGVGCVSNDKRVANLLISRVVDFIANSKVGAELVGYEIEVL